MDDKKTSSALRRAIRLAYAQPDDKQRKYPRQSLPGPLFDATVIGLFLVLVVACLV